MRPVFLPELLLVRAVAKHAFENTSVLFAAIAHHGRAEGVGSSLEGIFELLPMWIVCEGFSSEGRFVMFLGIKAERHEKRHPAKTVTNVNFLDRRLVQGESDHHFGHCKGTEFDWAGEHQGGRFPLFGEKGGIPTQTAGGDDDFEHVPFTGVLSAMRRLTASALQKLHNQAS
jgi:hypothetical protein